MTQKNVAQHLELYEYQKKILESIRNENIKRIVVVAGRKIGKSMLASESARWFAKKLLKVLIVEPSMILVDVIKDYVNDNDRRIYALTDYERQSIEYTTVRRGRRWVRGKIFDVIIFDDVFFDITNEMFNEFMLALDKKNGKFIVFATIPPEASHTIQGYRLLKYLFNDSKNTRFRIPSTEVPCWQTPEGKEILEEYRTRMQPEDFKREFEAEF